MGVQEKPKSKARQRHPGCPPLVITGGLMRYFFSWLTEARSTASAEECHSPGETTEKLKGTEEQGKPHRAAPDFIQNPSNALPSALAKLKGAGKVQSVPLK